MSAVSGHVFNITQCMSAKNLDFRAKTKIYDLESDQFILISRPVIVFHSTDTKVRVDAPK